MADETTDALQREFELIVSQMCADVEVVKAVLRTIATSLIQAGSDPSQALAALKRGVVANLATVGSASSDPLDDERMRQLLLHRVEDFFLPMEELLGAAPPTTPRDKH